MWVLKSPVTMTEVWRKGSQVPKSLMHEEELREAPEMIGGGGVTSVRVLV